MSTSVKPVTERRVLDVSNLPVVMFGHTNVSWLGNVFYMMIEGVMFALVIASYFYLRTRSSEWPPGGGMPPTLRYGVASGILFLLSVIPARWVQVQARRQNRANTQIGVLVLGAFGVAAIVLRAFEFTTLNCRWDANAYASVIWVLIGVHTGHLITEWIETVTIGAISFTPRMEGTRFVDVTLNSDYWYFVVASAVIVDFVIYGTTRLL